MEEPGEAEVDFSISSLPIPYPMRGLRIWHLCLSVYASLLREAAAEWGFPAARMYSLSQLWEDGKYCGVAVIMNHSLIFLWEVLMVVTVLRAFT